MLLVGFGTYAVQQKFQTNHSRSPVQAFGFIIRRHCRATEPTFWMVNTAHIQLRKKCDVWMRGACRAPWPSGSAGRPGKASHRCRSGRAEFALMEVRARLQDRGSRGAAACLRQ